MGLAGANSAASEGKLQWPTRREQTCWRLSEMTTIGRDLTGKQGMNTAIAIAIAIAHAGRRDLLDAEKPGLAL
jgi:hypothetical protein